MPPVGFEPTISAGERPQTYFLDRADSQVNAVDNCNIKVMNIDYLDDLTWKFCGRTYLLRLLLG